MTKFDYKKYFKNKKITKQGFGVLGRGFGVVKFLQECEARITVTDVKPKDFFMEQIEELKDLKPKNFQSIKYVLGEHKEEDFLNCDFIIQASGVPKDNHYLNLAKKNKVPVYQESSLFCKIVKENLPNVKIIGITGTRGKTTTTFLIYEIIKKFLAHQSIIAADAASHPPQAGTVFRRSVFLGGNIQGVATLEILKEIQDGDIVVMELDSWILQGFGDTKFSPHIAVFTNFMSDHMNYYKNNMKEYFLDKANIFLYQNFNNFFVTTESILQNIQTYIPDFSTQKNVFQIIDEEKIKSGEINYKTFLLGKHNQISIALAEKVSDILEIPKDIFLETVKNFKGVEGRLEFVREIKGVKIYNDTCATTGEATIAGLNAIMTEIKNKYKKTGTTSKIVLISGGRDKELDMSNLQTKMMELQQERLLEIIFLKDETTTGTNKLLENINTQNLNLKYSIAVNLQEAVQKALDFSESGDYVLFSPSFASFGMFQNEYDRGGKFNDMINKL